MDVEINEVDVGQPNQQKKCGKTKVSMGWRVHEKYQKYPEVMNGPVVLEIPVLISIQEQWMIQS